jgi:transcriptional regulator with XRE-family HTH domain
MVGEKIREWRKRSTLRQAEVADALGVTQSAVSRWEGGAEVPPAYWPALSGILSLSEEETEQLRTALLDQYTRHAAA